MEASYRPAILWVRLNMAFQLINYEIQKALKQEDITLPQLDILVCLGRTEGLTLGEMGERLLVTGGNITGLVDRLERSGYVYRERDQKDRRIIRAKLTPKGAELHKEILPIFRTRLNQIMNVLPAQEQRELNRLLKRLSQSLLATSGMGKAKKGKGVQ
jgi:DNA-binding MarR family transcriptional regulator